jgi:hypothetical protein
VGLMRDVQSASKQSWWVEKVSCKRRPRIVDREYMEGLSRRSVSLTQVSSYPCRLSRRISGSIASKIWPDVLLEGRGDGER